MGTFWWKASRERGPFFPYSCPYDNTKIPAILVVEDDAESRTAMVKILDAAGYKTAESGNGQEGLDRVIEGGIDIIVTDMRLPVMDGVELLKRAKSVDQEIEV